MRISEVAEQTGLSVSNIRFYEKKGLIEPDREKQSKYRDYTKEDVRRLKIIILYRKMDIPIETIADLIEQKADIDTVLKQQIVYLGQEMQRLQGSVNLCEKMAADPCRAHDDINVDLYLNYVKEEEEQGRSFAEVEEFLEDFAEFTQYRIIRDSWVGWILLAHPSLTRIVGIGWCAFWLLFPIFMIIAIILDEDRVNAFSIGFWSIWLLAFGISFWQFHTARKNKQKDKGS